MNATPAAPPAVLVVDDDAAVLSAAATLLDEAGYAVTTLNDGRRLLDTASRLRPACILLDLVMPETNGLSCLHMLDAQPELRRIPVIVFSGQNDRELARRALQAGAADYLVKDAGPDALLDRVRTWVQRGRGPAQHVEEPLEHIAALLRRLNELQDEVAVAQAVVADVAHETGAERVSVVAFELGQPVVLASSDDPTLAPIRLQLREYPEVRAAIASGRPLIVDTHSSSSMADLLFEDRDRLRFRTMMLFPALHHGQVHALLFLRSHRAAASFSGDALAYARAVAGATAAPLGYAAVLRREQAARQMAESERAAAATELSELKTIEHFFDRVGDGLVIVDRAGDVLRANRSILRQLGHPVEAVVGHRMQEFIAPTHREATEQFFQRFAAGTADAHTFEVDLVDRGGRTRTFEATIEPLVEIPDAAIIDLHDVTERNHLERELGRAKQQLENVIHSSPDAIVATDREGIVALMNPSALRLTGFRAADVAGGKVRGHDLFADGELYRIQQRIRQSGEAAVHNLRSQIRAGDGTRIPIVLNAAALIDEFGEPAGLVAVLTDMRQREELERQLKEAREQLIQTEREAAVAALAGATAHHLNQPLTTMLGYVQLVRRRHADLQAEPALDQIEQAAERIAEIVREIGRITRFETRRYGSSDSILELSGDGGSKP